MRLDVNDFLVFISMENNYTISYTPIQPSASQALAVRASEVPRAAL